jgi:putative transposase
MLPDEVGGSVMKKSKFTETEIIYAVKQAKAGVSVREVAHKYGVSEKTIYTWRNQYGGLSVNELDRLKQLEQENTKLKQMVPELSLDKGLLQEVLRKKG